MVEEEIKKESNKALVITGIVLAILIIGLITNGFGLFDSSPKEKINVTIGNSPVLGNENAPISMFIFSDFSCPYCAVSALQATPKIIDEYVNQGKVKLIFKYFPTHASGEASHKVAFCLNKQNLFWKFHDLAFANQANVGNLDKMKNLSKQTGANQELLNTCLNSTNFQNEFQKDIQSGIDAGIKGTPSFVINGKLYEGLTTYEQMKKAIDESS